jgi:hypothetical protein
MFSETILAKNLAALETAQGTKPALAALDASSTRAVGDLNLGLRLEILTAAGSWVPLDGPDPYDEAATQLESFAPTFPTQIIIIGPGLGYLLDLLEAAHASTKVVVIEPDPGVAVLFLSRRDWSAWFNDGRLRLLTGPEYHGVASLARSVDTVEVSSIIVNPVLSSHRPAAVERAQAVAQRIVAGAEANADARRRFAGRYLLQTLGNIDVIAREGNVAALDGVFRNKPAVVIGAGPSLDENLPALAANQDRVVIIAADTTLRPLMAAGVRPHIVVGVDPSDLNARHLAGVPDTQDIWLAAEGSLHQSAFEGFAGRTFVFKVSDHEPWPWLRSVGGDRGTIRAWGSVATSAFDLALRMGCDPVIFAGMDLAFTGLRPYCTNTIWDGVWKDAIATYGCTWQQLVDDYFSRQPEMYTTDVHGAKVRTASHLIAFRDWLLDEIARTDRTFINVTGGGALHGRRLRQANIEDVVRDLPRLDPPPAKPLRAAHAASTRASDDLVAAKDDLARSLNSKSAAQLLDRWVAFTAGSVTKESIVSVIRQHVGEPASFPSA